MGRFDAALKHSIAAHPADWARFLGVPDTVAVEAVDTDLSSVQQAVDKLLRVASEPATLIHIEFHAWSDGDLDERVLLYHSTVLRREKLPVHSVVFLLDPRAWRQDNRGGVSNVSPYHGCRLEFTYQIIKVWELLPETFLHAGVGLLPLAPLANVAQESLPAVIEAMTERLRREVPRPDAAELWTATHILMGLKYDPELVGLMLQKVRSIMVQSATYQEILREGRAAGREEGREEGRERGKQEMLLLQGSRRFGTPSEGIRARILSIHDPDALDELSLRVLDASSWDDLMNAAGS